MASHKYSVPYSPSEEAMPTRREWLTIVVEGNLGAGKSTLLDYLAQSESCEIIHEPLDGWKNCEGYNILKLSYTEPEIWMFTFEASVFIHQTKLHRRPSKKPIKVMERSVYAARNCFAENSYNMGLLNAAEYKILDDLFQLNTEKGDCHVDLFVYIRTDPSRCMKHLKDRGRPEEMTVDRTYISNIHQLYEQWFCLSENTVPGETKPSVVVIDGNRTKDEVLQDALTQIQSFIESKGLALTILQKTNC